MSRIELHNIDCLPYMKQCSDKQFDLAIVDPPYGIGMDGGLIGGDNLGMATRYEKKEWDIVIPQKEYFQELQRISRNQIIWGGNYFIENLKNSSCWIVWDKDNSGNFADAELAWTSFKTAVRIYQFRWNGMLQQDMKNKELRIHPTQKPVALYKWLLHNYAKPGDKIIDTHLGSGSIALACEEYGFDLTACEIDKEYFDAASKRLSDYRVQMRLF